ncbi:MAG: hypothetical protein ACLFQ3_06605 [Thiohalorhabdus sp.]
MSRGLTTEMQDAAKSRAVRLVHLVEIHYSGATVFYTDAYKDLVYSGATYKGNGVLLSSGEVEEDLKLRVQSIKITLSTVPQAVLSEALSSEYLNRLVVVRKGLLDADEKLIPDPVSVFRGLLSSYRFQEDPDQERGQGSSRLTWTAQDEFSDFERTTGRRTNNNDQQLYYPGDVGMEFCAQELSGIKWGRS